MTLKQSLLAETDPGPPPSGVRVSFVVPALNEATLVTTSLRALSGYRRNGHEVLLVDGGSCDGTAELAQPLVDAVIPSARGRARQMNTGARHATGSLLVFLHIDTRLDTEAFDALLHASVAAPGRWGRFDVRLEPSRGILPVIARFMNLRSRLTGIATGDQAMFADRRLFERVGGFPEIPLMEDVALSACLKHQCAPLCLRKTVTSSARKWLDEGVLKTMVMMWILRLAFALGVDPHKLHRIYYRT